MSFCHCNLQCPISCVWTERTLLPFAGPADGYIVVVVGDCAVVGVYVDLFSAAGTSLFSVNDIKKTETAQSKMKD